MSNALMGRPKRKSDPDAPVPEYQHVGMRVRVEWADWLERAANHCRTDVSKLIDQAVCEYARVRGFEEPPPKRY